MNVCFSSFFSANLIEIVFNSDLSVGWHFKPSIVSKKEAILGNDFNMFVANIIRGKS